MSNSDNQGKNPDSLFQNSDLPAVEHTRTDPVKEAAVLVPLIRENGNWSVLFIRRAENERDRHSGQVAFPGGRRDPDDSSIIDTALRELNEEIGIPSDGIELLGTLHNYLTISHFQITPVVGIVPWPNLIKMQAEEVARVFSIPLAWLRDTRNLEIKAREFRKKQPDAVKRTMATELNKTRPDQTKIEKVARHPVIYYHEYDDELLWGATARMTLNLGQAIDNGSIVLP